ncbi:MAG: hypothetical protein WBB69_10245 [Anaerolineales bacterium]
MNNNHLVMISCSLPLMFLLSAYTRSNFPTGSFLSEAGNEQLDFTIDGGFTYYLGGVVDSIGTFSVKGHELTWETDSYCDDEKATYTWAFENDTLVFQVKGKDKCSARFRSLHNIPYHRIK